MITGMRRGETCVLRWSDIDLDRCTIVIERSSEETHDRVIREKGTKSGQMRRIGLDDYTIELLRQYHHFCAEQCKSLGIEVLAAGADLRTVAGRLGHGSGGEFASMSDD